MAETCWGPPQLTREHLRPVCRFGDRLGTGFTILLTVVAYSLVIADCIPTLGYLTFMDKCNLAGYDVVMVSLVVLQLSFVEYSYPSSEAKRAILPCHAMPCPQQAEPSLVCVFITLDSWYWGAFRIRVSNIEDLCAKINDFLACSSPKI